VSRGQLAQIRGTTTVVVVRGVTHWQLNSAPGKAAQPERLGSAAGVIPAMAVRSQAAAASTWEGPRAQG